MNDFFFFGTWDSMKHFELIVCNYFFSVSTLRFPHINLYEFTIGNRKEKPIQLNQFLFMMRHTKGNKKLYIPYPNADNYTFILYTFVVFSF